jgi:hypothetical protein
MVCFAVLPVLSDSIYAQGPFEEINEKLDIIQETLDNEVIPKLEECPECPGCEVALPKTGQTDSYGMRDDGELEKGAAWKVPRFKDNEDGTVTDNLTGLIWLKNANCDGRKTWAEALTFCNSLAAGQCGLTDGSIPGDWRLPNILEMVSLIHWGVYSPCISDTEGTGQWSQGDPFTNVETAGYTPHYWTSTSFESPGGGFTEAFCVPMTSGGIDDFSKSTEIHVWPVRGPVPNAQ